MPKKRKLTPYQRIVRAANAGRGLRLSADEAFTLGIMDDAITTRAQLDDDEVDQSPKIHSTANVWLKR